MPKKLTKRQIERKNDRKTEKDSKKELSRLKKEDPDKYTLIMNERIMNTQKDRIVQVNRLKEKLINVGILEYCTGFKKFIELSDKFIKNGVNVIENISIEEMNGVYLVVDLNSNECSITAKNLKLN
jgi:hypothetical protein